MQLNWLRKKVLIQGRSVQAVYWALQTLNQLRFQRNGKFFSQLVKWMIGLHFLSRDLCTIQVEVILPLMNWKKEIALLSYFKLNVFVASYRKSGMASWKQSLSWIKRQRKYYQFPGKFYTIEEAMELGWFLQKASGYGDSEIDMPGHGAVFRRAFHCSMQSASGKTILKRILGKVCSVFDVPYIHIGTDEWLSTIILLFPKWFLSPQQREKSHFVESRLEL